MPTLVALDIETTGLDHQKDAVLEIGAVRFNERRVEGEWSTFVNPGRSIPPFITQLTGITNEMVSNAPPLRNVLGDLVKFIGDAPVVGHNVSFDLSFLRKNKVLGLNEAMDTYEMASILLPGAGRYNLGALAQALGIPYPHDNIHRALTDAKLTRSVFLRLYEIALHLPIDLLAEIVRISEPLEWGGYWAFRSVLQTRSRETVRGRPTAQAYAGPLFDQRPVRIPNFLQPKDTLCPLDVDEVSSVLEPGGAFSRHFPNFEYRLEQVAMLRAVAEALTNGRHLMVEAGTGVGKSVAYLIPAVTWAVQNNIRVVISTNTINLQDQLINKDIPDVRAALGIDFQAAVLKGRANYLCPRRLDNLRRRGPESSEEMRVLAKILVWLQSSSSGDRAEINLNGPVEREVWMRISAEDEGCTSDSCMQRTGGTCPFHRARLAAQSAHILIVNHALLLADVATGNRVLPEYDYLIVDEAHHLEEATTSSLSFRVNQFEIDGLIRLLGGPSAGTLSWALKAMEPLLAPADLAAYTHLVHRAADLAFQLDHLARGFFATIEQFLVEQREGRTLGPYAHQERILPATRTQPAWGEVEMAWDEAEQALQPLLDTLAKIAQGVAELMDGMQEEGQDLFGQLSTIYRRFSEVYEHLHALVFEPDQERVYWAEVQSDGRRLSLHAAPLHIGPLMQRFLWHEKSSVILTSATLTAAGEFDYLRSRLYADDAYELALGSPFDYESAVLVYIPEDIPEPNERYNYQKAVDRSLIQLCQATGGRTLVLFTSYAQLRNTAQSIGPVLADRGILVYEQGEGASPHALLETFRSADKAVLLGTRAFWEGVDVPGEALSVLVIVKLPFDVPTDPIVAARSETFEDSFNQYSLPEAILRFRQGFGRLIRTQSDRGVVALLDRRVLTKRYGKVFIDSLPGCTVRVGLLANLPREATRWLNL
jgi:DNA polymerase-3 subunit epsilon/ATP-dependent DNA helicase DinG